MPPFSILFCTLLLLLLLLVPSEVAAVPAAFNVDEMPAVFTGTPFVTPARRRVSFPTSPSTDAPPCSASAAATAASSSSPTSPPRFALSSLSSSLSLRPPASPLVVKRRTSSSRRPEFFFCLPMREPLCRSRAYSRGEGLFTSLSEVAALRDSSMESDSGVRGERGLRVPE